MYAFTENFICPLSHDEVVHGKCSLIGRMPGDWWRQFAGLRTLAFYQMTHPGAKLNFMGNEIGQFIEWRYYESIQWFLTEEYETHRHHQAFIKALNHLYTAEPALYERGYTDRRLYLDRCGQLQAVHRELCASGRGHRRRPGDPDQL